MANKQTPAQKAAAIVAEGNRDAERVLREYAKQGELRRALLTANQFCIYAERSETLDAIREWSEHTAKDYITERFSDGAFHVGVGREDWFRPWYSDGQIDLTVYVEPPSTSYDAYRMDVASIPEYLSQKYAFQTDDDVRKHMAVVMKYATRLGAVVVFSHRMDEHPPIFCSPMDWQLHVLAEPYPDTPSLISDALDDCTRRDPDGRK